MNTGSSVSEGISNFFIHIVIGAIFSEIANSDMVESASHPHPHTYGGAPSFLKHLIDIQQYHLLLIQVAFH